MMQLFLWRQEAPGTSPPATYAEVMSGSQGEKAERGSVAVVQSVDRALSVLEILAAQGEAGVTEVAAELGVHKSTAFRLVAALENRGRSEEHTSELQSRQYLVCRLLLE